jgi:hypothetical protein
VSSGIPLLLDGAISDFNHRLRWAQPTLYAVNALFLIWAIIAVELCLIWNQVTLVYTLNSTGQLIPLIIGVVGLLRLIQGLSVNKSHLTAIEILMVSS